MLSFILRNKLKTICINYFVKFSLYLGRMFLLSKYNHIVQNQETFSEMMLTIYTTNILSIFIYNVSISVNTMNTA